MPRAAAGGPWGSLRGGQREATLALIISKKSGFPRKCQGNAANVLRNGQRLCGSARGRRREAGSGRRDSDDALEARHWGYARAAAAIGLSGELVAGVRALHAAVASSSCNIGSELATSSEEHSESGLAGPPGCPGREALSCA